MGSYGLTGYQLGAGSISEDARGRWYINIMVKVEKSSPFDEKADLGIDLGLKDFAAFSDQSLQNVKAMRSNRDLEPQLAMAQLANKKRLLKTIHARITNRRKDH